MAKNKIYKLINLHGVQIEFLALGGKIISWKVPEKNGITDIVVGYDYPADYFTEDEYVGALCGRYANRIKNGRVNIDGKTFQLSQNTPPHHLHGGNEGFHKKLWKIKPVESSKGQSFELRLFSPDGEEGYPGNLKTTVIYTLTDNNEFIIDLKAVTDKPTIVNLTSHSYFNLNGTGKENVSDHFLQIFADRYTPLDKESITTGEMASVENTPLDFRQPKLLSESLRSNFPQIKSKGGIDLNWVLNRYSHELSKAVMLHSKQTGITLEIWTTQPGLQVYTGQHFPGKGKGKSGYSLQPFCGVALETQGIPDAPNKPHFPNSFLYPGEVYHQKIIYKFYSDGKLF